ncbi:MAG: AsmA family protein [Stenotrophomonas sp.]
MTDGSPRPASTLDPRLRFLANHPRRRRWLAVLGLLSVLFVVLVALFDWNWFKGPIERAVAARTGREFRIHGNFDVDLGSTATLRGDRLTFANADWSRQAQMAQADRVEIELRLWPLLRGKVDIPAIRLTAPSVLLETAPAAGQPGNWAFMPPSSSPSRITLQRLLIHEGKLHFVDRRGKTDIALTLESGTRGADAAASPVAVRGEGRWHDNPFTLSGHTESPLELSHTQHPFRVRLDGRAGATRARVSGTLTHPFQLRVFDLKLALSGQDMQDLYPLIGLAIPSTPPYQLDGRLKRDHDTWRYDGFSGTLGDSDLAGSARIEVGGKRPFLQADLVSKRLDFDDLAGFINAPPKTGKGESANAQQKANAAQLAASTRLLPQTPYNLGKLRAMDADVRWKAQHINAPSLPLDDMDAHLLLDDGLLRLDPLNFGVAGGDIRATIRMDARKDTLSTALNATLRKLQLGQLFPDAKLAQQATGGINGQINLAGRGNSIAAMLGSADGDVALGMGRGHIGNLVMELAGLDVAESLKFLLTGDRQIPLRCAFADFAVKDGLMQSRALAFDTSDTLIVGEGDVSLKQETLDLLLKPRPKDISILALRSPLRVGGSFKDPSFRPDFKALGLRGAIALTLASIAPPAALLATLETGPGEDSNCGGRYAR